MKYKMFDEEEALIALKAIQDIPIQVAPIIAAFVSAIIEYADTEKISRDKLLHDITVLLVSSLVTGTFEGDSALNTFWEVKD